MTSPTERLSRRQREATPQPFARYLVERVRRITGAATVAVLWVQRGSVYEVIDGVETWGIERDAMRYEGPHPIVAHPTCGPWGKLAWRSRQDRRHGIRAVELVERYGGVCEQPVGSRLFRDHAEPFRGHVEQCRQGDYGHVAPKPTLLYWCRGEGG